MILLVRKNMDINEHERLSNITHRHNLKANSPVNRPVDPKQIATEVINTPAFSL